MDPPGNAKRAAAGPRRLWAQHFTPAPVADLLWQAAYRFGGYVGKGLRVIDPAAGAGALLEAARRSGQVDGRRLRGIEIDASLVDGAGAVRVGNGLDATPGDGTYDIVLGNPPFGRAQKVGPRLNLGGLKERFASFSRWGGQAAAMPLEVLFLERALQLARPGGIIAYILPEGFLTNARQQAVRDGFLQEAALLAAIELPDGTFRRPGLHAQTALVVLRRLAAGEAAPPALLIGRPEADWQIFSERCLKAIAGVGAASRRALPEGCLRVAPAKLGGARWDARSWAGRHGLRQLARRFAMVRLGDHIAHMTYGPIVTGQRPRPCPDGIPVVRQQNFADSGLRLENALKVRPGGIFDPARSRVQRGDLLLPRSGAGALGRNRLGVYWAAGPANIACFVDLLRLEGLNPFYVWLFFKTRPGWGQMRSLINGVGTPNISFAEIRSLKLPWIDPAEQKQWQRRYCRRVLPVHRRPDEAAQAQSRFAQLVEALEQRLASGR